MIAIAVIAFFFIGLIAILYYFYRKNAEYVIVYSYDQLAKHLLGKPFTQIGVDTEYYRGQFYQGKLCLIQLSIEANKKVIILDLIEMNKKEKELIGEGLRKIFEDPSIEKVFHSCPNDIEWLQEEFNMNIRNIFDTQEFDRVLHHNKSKRGLNNLLKDYLSIEASTKAKIFFQKSNWLNRPLTSAQLNYAASDSYHLLPLREKLVAKLNEDGIRKIKGDFEAKLALITKQEKNEEKALKFFTSNETKTHLDVSEIIKKLYIELIQMNEEYAKEHNINPELLLDLKTAFKLCTALPFNSQTTVDEIISKKKYEVDITQHAELFNKVKSAAMNASASIPLIQSQNKEDNANAPSLTFKSKKEQIIEKFSCKHPIYESCKMLAPDGEVLCICDTKKMNWYVSRKIAEMISDDPPVFKLIFEPNEKGCNDEDGMDSKFYTTERLNRCVVCGCENQYMRFHIIPVLYRQFFPEQLKSHKSHDVNLLCFNCNEKANKLYEVKKKQISEQYGVPLKVCSKPQEDFHSIDTLIRKAKILVKQEKILPSDTQLNLKEQMLKVIEELRELPDHSAFFSGFFKEKASISMNDLSSGVIEKIARYKPKMIPSSDRKNLHGKLVVDQIKDLKDFIREWRTFFVNELKPKYLPSDWRIDHQIVRTFGKLSQFKTAKDVSDKNSHDKVSIKI